ncbi:MAG TPA: DUF2269 family protein [Mycobacteriales bacterium]|jgi:uncharacterized membrane protein|nr:DUF2269 family protein [Mycobacteriales bacterium]
MFTLHKVLLTLHILTAIVTIGWLSMQAMLMPRAIRSGNAGAVRLGASMAERIGPIASVVFLLGLWLVGVSTDAELKDPWIGAAMLLFIVALVNGAVFIGRTEKRAAERLEAGQAAPEEAKRVAMLGGINALLLLVIVFLMVAKPGN